MRKIGFAAAAAAAWIVGSAAAVPQKTDPEVILKEKKIIDASPSGMTLVFHLILKNAASTPVNLARYDYKVVIDEAEYLNLQVGLDEPLEVGPKGEIVIVLPVKLNYENLFPAVPGLKDKDLAFCYVAGGMTFRDERRREKRVLMAFSSDFPVYRGLDIGPAPVETASLTIGGAEITGGIVLRNPNGFSFTLNRLTYVLELVGRPVARGVSAEDLQVAAKGEASIPIPVTLDFFEVGRPVHDGLVQPPVSARVSGEAEIMTPWGPWRVAFDRSDKVAVRKRLS